MKVTDPEWDRLLDFIGEQNSEDQTATISMFFHASWVSLVVAQEKMTVTGFNVAGNSISDVLDNQDDTPRQDFEVQIVHDEHRAYEIGDFVWQLAKREVIRQTASPDTVIMLLVNASEWCVEITNYELRKRRTATHSSLSACLELLSYVEWQDINPAIVSHGDIIYAHYNQASTTDGHQDQGDDLRGSGSGEDDSSSTS